MSFEPINSVWMTLYIESSKKKKKEKTSHSLLIRYVASSLGIQKRRYFDTVLVQASTTECEFNSLSVWRGFMPLHLYKHSSFCFLFKLKAK